MSQNHSNNGTQKGLSPIVLLLLVVALLTVAILISNLYLAKHKKDDILPSESTPQPQSPSVTTGNTEPSDPKTEPIDPESPADVDNENVKLSVTKKRVHFNSGAELSYGYPSLTLVDAPDIENHINEQLKALVDERIIPVIEQMALEDNPSAFREYSFSLSKGCGYYSIIVTVDINEGITSAREIYGWNFFCDSGDFLQLASHCSDKLAFASAIDSCLENVASYDQIIHQWLIDVITSEHESNEFSFYFEENSMVAVLNKRLRLNSYDRDPIPVIVPYTKISNIFSNTVKEQ